VAGARPAVAGARPAVAGVLFEATVGAAVAAAALGFLLHDYRLGPAWPALGWLALLALTSQVIGWLLITVSMPQLAAGVIGALLLIQPAGSVALSYAFLGERPSVLQLLGVVLVLAGVVVAVSGNAPRARGRPGPATRGTAPGSSATPAPRPRMSRRRNPRSWPPG
jgi:drug/metabolite transporter (DMT)-like permease